MASPETEMLKRAGLGYAIPLLSLVFQILAYVLFIDRVNPAFPAEWRTDFSILLGVSLVLTVLLTVFRKVHVVSVLLLVKASIVLLVTVPLGDLAGVRILLLSSVLMEIGIHLPLPFGLGAVGALALAFALRQDPAEAFRVSLSRPTVLDTLTVLVVALSIAALSVLLRLVAGRLSEEREAAVRLNSSVEKLTKANTEFLQYASVVERESVASERNRITRDLGSTIARTKWNASLRLSWASGRCNGTQAGRGADAVHDSHFPSRHLQRPGRPGVCNPDPGFRRSKGEMTKEAATPLRRCTAGRSSTPSACPRFYFNRRGWCMRRYFFGGLVAVCFSVWGMCVQGEPTGLADASVAPVPACRALGQSIVRPSENDLYGLSAQLSFLDLPDESHSPPDLILLADEPKKVTIPGLSPRNQFADTAHLVLGVATVIVGGATGLLSPENAGYDLHHALGWTAAGLAAGTLLTGAWAHSGDVGVSMGLNPINIHALLGIAGGLLMIAAPLTAPGGRGGEGDGEGGLHAALGAGGELLMIVAIALPIAFRPAPLQ